MHIQREAVFADPALEGTRSDSSISFEVSAEVAPSDKDNDVVRTFERIRMLLASVLDAST